MVQDSLFTGRRPQRFLDRGTGIEHVDDLQPPRALVVPRPPFAR